MCYGGRHHGTYANAGYGAGAAVASIDATASTPVHTPHKRNCYSRRRRTGHREDQPEQVRSVADDLLHRPRLAPQGIESHRRLIAAAVRGNGDVAPSGTAADSLNGLHGDVRSQGRPAA